MKRLIIAIIGIISIALNALPQVVVEMEQKQGVFYVPGSINGLSLKFILDTGASDVYISLTEALFMLKNGYLSDDDLGNTTYSQIANGVFVENTEVTLREVKIGPVKISNVKALISDTLESPLLLGQTAIQKLGAIQLDGNKLIINNGVDINSDKQAKQLYYRAYEAVEAGRFEEAIGLSIQALNVATDHSLRATLWDNLACAYANSGEKDKAIDAEHKALGEDITAEQPAYNLGVYLFEENRFSESLRAFDNFIERHSNTTNASALAASFSYKGDCHYRLGEMKMAEVAYKRSLSIMPSPMAQFGLADLYMNSNQYSNASTLYKEALSYEPYRFSNIKRWHQYGFCLFQLKQVEMALDAFRHCIMTLQKNEDYVSLALKNEGSVDEDLVDQVTYLTTLALNAQLWVARLQNDPRQRITEYEQAYKLPGVSEDFNIQDYILWSNAYEQAQATPLSRDKRLEIIKLGMTKFPDNPDILFNYSLLIPDEDPIGMDCLMKILSQEFSYTPVFFDFATVYNNIAWRMCLSGDNSEALPYALHSIQLDASHDYSWETLGEIYFNLGRFKECVDAMTQCINLGGDCKKSAYDYRSKSYLKLGKKKEANQDIEQFKLL